MSIAVRSANISPSPEARTVGTSPTNPDASLPLVPAATFLCRHNNLTHSQAVVRTQEGAESLGRDGPESTGPSLLCVKIVEPTEPVDLLRLCERHISLHPDDRAAY